MRLRSAVLALLLTVLVTACGGSGATRTQATAPVAAAMPTAGFWALVATARQRASATGAPDVAAEAAAMRALLSKLPGEQVSAYQRRLVLLSQALYTTRMAAAADLVAGQVSPDEQVFTTFRSWVVAQGEVVYDKVLADPDALADLPDVQDAVAPGPDLFGTAGDARWLQLGHQVGDAQYPSLAPTERPSGDDLEGDDVTEQLPRLSARFGAPSVSGG